MMTSREPWKRFTAGNEVHIVGEFENEHGEQFVIYRMKNGDTPYFTGDEVDWQPRVHLLWNPDFTFNEVEREHIGRILWPMVGEQVRTLDKLVAEGRANTSTMTSEEIAKMVKRELIGDIEAEQRAAAEHYAAQHPNKADRPL